MPSTCAPLIESSLPSNIFWEAHNCESILRSRRHMNKEKRATVAGATFPQGASRRRRRRAEGPCAHGWAAGHLLLGILLGVLYALVVRLRMQSVSSSTIWSHLVRQSLLFGGQGPATRRDLWQAQRTVSFSALLVLALASGRTDEK